MAQKVYLYAYALFLSLASCAMSPQAAQSPGPPPPNAPPAMATLGLSGTTMIEILVLPDGHVAKADVYKSSGIQMIDQYALQHAEAVTMPPLSDQVPQKTRVYVFPVEVAPATN